jgi:nicotinamidase-related amidase
MATIRKGDSSVLLVVDVQVGVMRHTWESSRIIENIARVVEKARLSGVPVIWVQHSDEELVIGSEDWQLVPQLTPREGETHIDKHFNSSFEETALEDHLAELSVTRIYLAGAATNWCIRATAYAALDRGYDLTVVADAHTTEPIELRDGSIINAQDIITDLNIAMTWLVYPGRKNKAVKVDELDFASER